MVITRKAINSPYTILIELLEVSLYGLKLYLLAEREVIIKLNNNHRAVKFKLGYHIKLFWKKYIELYAYSKEYFAF